MGAFCDLAGGAYSWTWFQIIFIYIYTNCLNIFLVNSGEVGAGTETGPKSGPEKLKIAVPDLLKALLSWAISPLYCPMAL